MDNLEQYNINNQRYRLTYLSLKLLFSISPIKLNIHNYHYQGYLGNIFLFNHFTRFETFVPQYILYDREKSFCRGVAFSPLFSDKLIGDYLRSVGAVPDDMKTLTDFMAHEIEQGKKIILYPEGSMIKDRRVRDDLGRLDIYKREGGYRRKPHTGAAVIGLKSRIARDLYLMAREKKSDRLVEKYRKKFPGSMALTDLDALAKSPIGIVPANITFYPLRRDENFFEKLVKKYSNISSKRALEEIKIEGNIFFKDTDMDIRFGKPLNVKDYLGNDYSTVLKTQFFIDSIFSGTTTPLTKHIFQGSLKLFEYFKSRCMKKTADRLRDAYMNAIYSLTTINLGHLVAHTLFDLHQRHPKGLFGVPYLRALLYMSIKELRSDNTVYLHTDLISDKYVNALLLGEEPKTRKVLEQFEKCELLTFVDNDNFTIEEKLDSDCSFDTIRLENPAQVLDNEANSVPSAIKTLDKFYNECGDDIRGSIQDYLMDKFLFKYSDELKLIQDPEHEEITSKEKRTESGASFLKIPNKKNSPSTGILLIHGFSASPAEMAVLGEELAEKNCTCLGLRLPGHGTSPVALTKITWEDWYTEVKLGLYLMQQNSEKVFIIGNSMGALLALMLSCESNADIAGLVCFAPAFKIRDKLFPFVTYADTARRIYEYFGKLRPNLGYLPFNPENPSINYSSVPLQGLNELYKVVNESQKYIEKVTAPTLFIQSDKDPTVDPAATYKAFERIPSKDKRIIRVDSENHVLTSTRGSKTIQPVLDFVLNTSKKEE